jgi:hypothetical protein
MKRDQRDPQAVGQEILRSVSGGTPVCRAADHVLSVVFPPLAEQLLRAPEEPPGLAYIRAAAERESLRRERS